jgi:DNA polymerase-3 subunit beta
MAKTAEPSGAPEGDVLEGDGTGEALPPVSDQEHESDPSDDGPPTDRRRRAVRVRASVLRGALKDVAGVVEARNTIPILAHVLIEAGNGTIVVTATNLDVWARRDCASDDRDGPGSAEWLASVRGFAVTVPAKPLGDILGELDGDAMVTIERLGLDGASEAEAATTGGQVAIAAGRARFKLHGLPASDFPLPPGFSAHAAFDMRCADLSDAFAKVEHAIGSDETRYYLNGVHVHPHQRDGEPQTLRFAATDGHRLARWRIDPPEGAASLPPLTVMAPTVTLLDRLLVAAVKAADEGKEPPLVLVEVQGEQLGALLRFSLPAGDGGEITVTAKSIDGTFPDYQRVIPTETTHSALFARAALAEAVKRVGVLTSDKTRSVKAVLTTDKLELVVTTPEVGEAREEVPCSYAGPDATIGFNGAYWRAALGALASDEVSLAFALDNQVGVPVLSPVLVRAAGAEVDPDALVQVLMPMRVA